ncbi:ABA4-like family protein [Candidatus Pelagibacter sp.]|nr:ABA4-like family protein [Candidatus Pelagibacter sp.]
MIEQIYTYFNIDMIYLWLNIGVLPFWIILIFFPNSKICKIFVTTVFPVMLLAFVYLFLVYEGYKVGFNLVDIFNLYLGIDELINLFNEKNFLILFWVHFIGVNLFCGSWIVKDYQRIYMPKFLTIIPLIFTYFVGPIGLFFYWMIRIFYTKKISLYD